LCDWFRLSLRISGTECSSKRLAAARDLDDIMESALETDEGVEGATPVAVQSRHDFSGICPISRLYGAPPSD
jgi:hypothetical protein